MSRYTGTGTAKEFTEGPNAGTNELTGQEFLGEGAGQMAVDSSGGLMNGNLYTTAVFAGAMNVYSNTGEVLGQITGLELPCGVAVDNSTGAVYIAEGSHSRSRVTCPPRPRAPVSATRTTR